MHNGNPQIRPGETLVSMGAAQDASVRADGALSRAASSSRDTGLGTPTMKNLASHRFQRHRYSQVAIVFLLLSPHLSGDFSSRADPSHPRATFESYYEQWLDLLKQKDALSADALSAQFAPLVDGLFYLDSLAPQIIPQQWEALTLYERATFVDALTSSIYKKVVSYVESAGTIGYPSLESTKDEVAHGLAILEYSIMNGRDETGTLTVRMLEVSENVWKISDLTYGGESMLRYYRGFSRKLLKDYSFPYLIAEMGDYEWVVLEDFESSPLGALPLHWTWKGADDDEHKPYAVRRENGGNYLEATDEGESVILGKDVKWDLRRYPYVSFRWRVHRIPEGADERDDNKVDSAAGIYFIYKRLLRLVPETVKYVWSSTLPVGAAVRRDGVGRPWMVVVETGTDHLGEWRTYVFNLRDAYRDTFGRSPPRKPIGIGVLSDANSMKSHAYADYDDIRALRTADAAVTSGVDQILQPKRNE